MRIARKVFRLMKSCFTRGQEKEKQRYMSRRSLPLGRASIAHPRHFRYEGVDGRFYSVREGNCFPVRPKGYPHTVRATPRNREWIEL